MDDEMLMSEKFLRGTLIIMRWLFTNSKNPRAMQKQAEKNKKRLQNKAQKRAAKRYDTLGVEEEIAYDNSIQSAAEGIPTHLDFKTVEWDKDARIIADPLEKLNVPYTFEHTSDNFVRFNFDGKDAKKVLSVVDFHLNNESSQMTKERFGNLDEVSMLARGEVPVDEDYEALPVSPEEEAKTKKIFKDGRIPFEFVRGRAGELNRFVYPSRYTKHLAKLLDFQARPQSAMAKDDPAGDTARIQRNSDDALAGRANEEPFAGKATQADTAAYVLDEQECKTLCDTLDSAQITYDVYEAEWLADAAKEIIVDDTSRESFKRNTQVAQNFDHYNLDTSISRVALNQACEMMPPDTLVAAEGVPTHLDFKTVKWDKDARIIADPLEKLNVPYTFEHTSDNFVRFNFDGKDAEKVLSVVDFHLNNESSKITKERFGNLDEVTHLVKAGVSAKDDKILTVTIEDPRQARALKQTFKNYGIEYQSFFSREDNSNVFNIRSSELYANALFQKNMEADCATVCKDSRALTRDEFEVTAPVAGTLKTHNFAQETKHFKPFNTPTPQKDITRARQSAAIRNQEQDLHISEKQTRSR